MADSLFVCGVVRVDYLILIVFVLVLILFAVVARQYGTVHHQIHIAHFVQHIIERQVECFYGSGDDCPYAVVITSLVCRSRFISRREVVKPKKSPISNRSSNRATADRISLGPTSRSNFSASSACLSTSMISVFRISPKRRFFTTFFRSRTPLAPRMKTASISPKTRQSLATYSVSDAMFSGLSCKTGSCATNSDARIMVAQLGGAIWYVSPPIVSSMGFCSTVSATFFSMVGISYIVECSSFCNAMYRTCAQSHTSGYFSLAHCANHRPYLCKNLLCYLSMAIKTMLPFITT